MVEDLAEELGLGLVDEMLVKDELPVVEVEGADITEDCVVGSKNVMDESDV